MEMASTHGLALKLVENINRLDRLARNELCEIISEEDKIIKSWFVSSNQSRFHKVEFFNLTRRTLLFVLSQSSLKEAKKKELLKGVSTYFHKFSGMLKNNLDIRKPLIDVILDPWKNKFFSWEELFSKRINVKDYKVQEYFHAEPEEIVLARAHFFSKQGKDDTSMALAKNSFLFHSRIAKNLLHSEFGMSNPESRNMNRKGAASMDWYLHNLRRKKSLISIYNELKQLTCHEGVLLIMRLRLTKRIPFAFTTLQLFIMQELVLPSKFCCTKKLFSLWCILHKEQKTSMKIINEEIVKMFAWYAPSSAHFYLLVDALWEQFGTSFINVYVDLYIRGLTVDLNHLEAARNGDVHMDVVYLESHISQMFHKLSTLFIDFHERAARECMFSAFSLKPTKERLCFLQSLTMSIIQNDRKSNSLFNHSPASVQECKCAVKCTGSCKSTKEYFLEHPILMKGIPDVPYSLLKDLVSVLENVRWICFQYNVFDWRNNDIDLGDYLRDFTLSKSWESDTECASEGSVKSDEDISPADEPMHPSLKMDVGSIQPSAKRRSESNELKEVFSLDVGANIEVGNEDFVSKRLKIDDQSKSSAVSTYDSFALPMIPPPSIITTLGMEDAIENVIRQSLDITKQKCGLPLDNSHDIYTSTSLSRVNDGTEKLNLPSIYKPISESPYLSNYETKSSSSKYKGPEFVTPLKSEVHNSLKYPYFARNPSALSHSLTSVNRESVISPTLNQQKSINTMQEQASRQMLQNKFLIRAAGGPCYNKLKNAQPFTVNAEKNVHVYQQEALNLETKSSVYDQVKSVSNTISQSSQFIANRATMRVLHKSDNSISDFSKPQYLSNTTNVSSSSFTGPINLIRPKHNAPKQSSQFPSASSHQSKSSAVFKTDSSFQVVDKNKTIVKRNQHVCIQDNQFVHCDRSSVIQHTMQHARESSSQFHLAEVEMPNQLAVSVNSDAVEQIRSAPKRDVTNLPPFTVSVNDRGITNSSLAVSANLVIARKPLPQICSHPSTSTDTITISGILASPSVIVSPSVIGSPWESHRKSPGEYNYKKNTNVVTSTIDKRIYKHRMPYGKQSFKPEPKLIRQRFPNDKNNSQVPKAIATPSHINKTFCAIPPANQSNAAYVNKSSQAISETTSSQPWYIEPYPKPLNHRNNPSTSTGNSSILIEKPSSKLLQPEVKSFSLGIRQMHPSKSMTMIIPTIQSHALSKIVSNSSTNSSVLNVSTISVPNSTTSTIKNSVLLKDYSSPSSPHPHFQSNNITNLKTYSTVHKPVKNSSPEPSSLLPNRVQFSTDLTSNKSHATYAVSDSTNATHQYSQASSRNFSCCSPSEINPCQNCSLPSENSLVQSSSEKIIDGHLLHVIPSSSEMILGNDSVVGSPRNSNFFSNKAHDGLEHSNATLSNCQYCSQPFLETELQIHILNCPSREFVKNNLMSELNSSVLLPESPCIKSLPDVPEQNSLFQKESFRNDLPHTKSYMNVEDDKNLEEIEAACMDIINSDKDLVEKMIMQGIDGSLDPIGNNYLPYIPPTDSPDDFLGPNICNDIRRNSTSETPVQHAKISPKNDQFNNYDVNCELPHSQESRLEVQKSFNSVFEFTEKEYASSKATQKLINSKPQIPYAEKMSASTSKTSGELTFSAIAEFLKASMTDGCQNELQSVELSLKDNHKGVAHAMENTKTLESSEFTCSLCLKKFASSESLKIHMNSFHNNSERNLPPNFTDLSSPINVPDCNLQLKTEVNSGSGHSLDSSNSLNYGTHSDVEHNLAALPYVLENNTLPKGRIKGITKSRTTECKYCGKTLTILYMKTHILKKHPEVIIKTENTSSDVNVDIKQNPASPVDSVSPLLEQDIDSSTCLSVSDALKRNNSYTVAESLNYFQSTDRLTENADVKFNFNVLEFSNTKKGPSPENVSCFEDKMRISNSSKKTKSLAQRLSCNLCNKSYNSSGTLNRHLRTIHNVLIAKAPKKNKANKLLKAENVKIEENERVPCTNFHKATDTSIENINILSKEANIHNTEKVTSVEQSAKSGENFIENTGEKCKKLLTLNKKKSLLKTVLQSNFAKDYKESREVYEKNTLIHDEKNNFCDTARTIENIPEVCSSNNGSSAKNDLEISQGDSLDAGSKFDKVSASVPFENLSETRAAMKSEDSSYLLMHSTNNHTSVSPNLKDFHSGSELPGIGTNQDIKYSIVADSQNSSVSEFNSNEISPIAEIISNISRCHFGASNTVNEKEVFEDNSLKLLIPDNRNESMCNINVDPINLHENIENNSNKISDCSKMNNLQINVNDENIQIENNPNKIGVCSKINNVQINISDKLCEVNDQKSINSDHNVAIAEQVNEHEAIIVGQRDISSEHVESVVAQNNTSSELELIVGQNVMSNKCEIVSQSNEHDKLIDGQSDTSNEHDKLIDGQNYTSNEHELLIDGQNYMNNEHEQLVNGNKDIGIEHNRLVDGQNDMSNEQDELITVQNNMCNEHDELVIVQNNQNDKYEVSVDQENLEIIQTQKLLQVNENSSINFYGESDNLFKKMLNVSSNSTSGGAVLENESSELENTSDNSDKSYVRCRICHQNLNTVDILMKHLKEVHDIPVLKKHVSQPPSPDKFAYPQEIGKLSPPKLKLGTNESDSESVSDYDNPHNWSKTPNNSSEQNSSKNGTLSETNLRAALPPLLKQCEQDQNTTIVHNLPYKLKKKPSVHPERYTEENHHHSSIKQSLNHLLPDLEHHPVASTMCKYKSRRHSFTGTCSVSIEKLNPIDNKELLSFDLKNTFYKSIKRKSISLPNLKKELQHLSNSPLKHSTKLSVVENKHVELSSNESTSFSSVTDNTEICKNSYDSSSSSQNSSWNKFTIKSSFVLSNPVRKKTILRSKFSGRKLIIQRLKTYKKEKKSKKKSKPRYFLCRKKFKSKKTCKPIILTLKTTIDVQEFLETHKQPIVKLIRLKDDEFDCLLNPKRNSISSANREKYNMKEAVVKLERIHIPSDLDKVVIFNQDLFVPNLLSQDTQSNSLSMQNTEDETCPNSFYLDSSNGDVSPEASMTHNPPHESIDLSDLESCSSESVQFLGAITKEAKCEITGNDFCSMPSTKKCFVVLNRISV